MTRKMHADTKSAAARKSRIVFVNISTGFVENRKNTGAVQCKRKTRPPK